MVPRLPAGLLLLDWAGLDWCSGTCGVVWLTSTARVSLAKEEPQCTLDGVCSLHAPNAPPPRVRPGRLVRALWTYDDGRYAAYFFLETNGLSRCMMVWCGACVRACVSNFAFEYTRAWVYGCYNACYMLR